MSKQKIVFVSLLNKDLSSSDDYEVVKQVSYSELPKSRDGLLDWYDNVITEYEDVLIFFDYVFPPLALQLINLAVDIQFDMGDGERVLLPVGFMFYDGDVIND